LSQVRTFHRFWCKITNPADFPTEPSDQSGTRMRAHSLVRRQALVLATSLTVAAFLGIAGCSSIFGPGDPSPGPITTLPRLLTAAEQEAIGASNEFGFDLLREVVSGDPGSSVFLSPLSASMALGMTMNGAAGGTFDAMRSTLRFGTLSEGEINASYRSLLELLTDLDPKVEIMVGNSVWHRAALTLRTDFRARVEENFNARVQGLDFGAPGAAEIINGWVREATRNRIDEIVTPPIPGNVIAYLINAVYFKAGWTVPFNPQFTHAGDFRLLDGSTERVEFMMRDDTIPFFQTDRYAAVDLPYAGQAFSATIVVPSDGFTLQDLIEELDPAEWRTITEGFRVGRVQVTLPRFEMEWESVLNGALSAMGMGAAFGPGANFSRMFESAGPWIDEVRQKSFVRVDEEGTEAAAVTSVTMVTSLPPQLRADRPFLFAIRERLTGTILFLGAIVEAPRL